MPIPAPRFWTAAAALSLLPLSIVGTASAHHRPAHSGGKVTASPSPSPTAEPTPTASPTSSPSPTASPTASSFPSPSPTTGPASATGLRVVGNKIQNASGQTIRLVGVNHAGPEYACKQGWGFFNGPSTETVSTEFVGTIAAWNANAVRVPLNEHCWLDINSNIPEHRRGHEYIAAITDYVAKLNAQGIVAILEPHWHAPGTSESVNGPMPNRDNSPRFWTSLASHFKSNPQVVFELVNEPHPDWNSDTDEAWRCWRDGGTCRGVNYTAAGMQELVTAIRNTGADQLILAGGVQYAHRLTQWAAHKPVDPLNNIAPAWHVYDFNLCTDAACWDRENGALADQYPLVATEIGPHMPDLFNWLDAKSAGFQAWTWNLWGGGHDLITDWSGTPTVWGGQIREQMRG